MENKIKAIKSYLETLQKLYEENILINRHSFTTQIGEWLVETIYDGERAKSGIQAGWDVKANGRFIQVKTHSKAKGNDSNFTAISKESTTHIDELIIINFSPDYKIREFYQVPWNEAIKHIKHSGKKNPREELNWSQIKGYKIEIDKLPKQEIVSLFK
jgi:hypothetical protein